LDDHLDRTGQRSEKQHGFRRGHSTVDAINRVIKVAKGAATGAVQHRDIYAMVSLDVRNAFKSVPWINRKNIGGGSSAKKPLREA
jgi:hypothetical protein